MVCELDVLGNQRIQIRHLATARLSARVHQHIANDSIRAFAMLSNLGDVLLQVGEKAFDIFELPGIQPRGLILY